MVVLHIPNLPNAAHAWHSCQMHELSTRQLQGSHFDQAAANIQSSKEHLPLPSLPFLQGIVAVDMVFDRQLQAFMVDQMSWPFSQAPVRNIHDASPPADQSPCEP